LFSNTETGGHTICQVKNMNFQDWCHKHLMTALAIYLSTLQMKAALEIVTVLIQMVCRSES